MNYIIYIDVYFFVNFFMNGLLLCLLKWSEGKSRTPLKGKSVGRMMLGAFVGGILSCLIMVLFSKISFIMRFLVVNGIIGYLMVWIAFDYRNVKSRFLAVGRLYLLEIILSGILNLFLRQKENFYCSTYNIEKQEEMGILPVAATSLFAAIVLREAFGNYKKERQICNHLYVVKMYHKENCYEGVGLLDTGNHLREPITGKAVIIVQLMVAEKLLGQKEALRIMDFGKGEVLENMPENSMKWIPYHSLGNQHGFMPGVVIDKMVICQGEKEQICEKVLIGIMEEELSKEQLYQLILHEEYIEFS